jgi:DNA-binding XRE family transcriptional regulator
MMLGRADYDAKEFARVRKVGFSNEFGRVTVSAAQLRAARGLLGWSQSDLAEAAKVGRATIADFETGKRDPYARTLDELRTALEAAGVEFTNGDQPGVRLRKGSAE